MKHSLHSKSTSSDPSYVIISMALVQSEIYWICSVLYHVFQSGLAKQQSLVHGTASKKQRSRLRSSSAPASPANYVLKFGDFVQLNQENALRRSSLPVPSTGEGSIRQRPSVHDEQKGTTCPPIWWQKTRVKLGRAPVHGDAKITADSPKQIDSPPTSTPSPSLIHFKEPTVPAAVKRNNTTPISATPTVNSPLLTPRSSTFPLSPSPSNANSSLSPPSIYTISEEEANLSRQASESSVPAITEHQQQQRVKKFMSKLNTALKSIPHHHRRNNSSDSKKSFKK
ncbi:hypothetical protein V8B55DRAFT_1522556 [Mucor lusitanicus]|uniref:Uncharacterized protein n=2 Tax=Mucor circinelloides f. lusitanicus TaxID=29924 RepID=A0A168LL28_MUCCL|nr:hypothetical protein FB192DRAFT_1393210 [Mucor lusitanicus]OAD03663.1 hypothetical protein MUCCIDRAFT_110538 [Mucor lusitanicus CBS 277.49]